MKFYNLQNLYNFTCVCDPGFSLAEEGTKCLKNCISTNLKHGEIKENQICFNGEMKITCKEEGKAINHGEKNGNQMCVNGKMEIACKVEEQIIFDRKTQNYKFNQNSVGPW